MKCLKLGSGLWALIILTCLDLTVGVHHHAGRHLKKGTSSLDDLLNRLDGSIQEHNTRLQRGLPSIHYRTDQPLEEDDDEDSPTIIQDEWEELTHLEAVDDTSDYVNIAPWTMRTTPNPVAQAQDLQRIKLASDNARWVNENGKCEVPLRRCVQVTSESPDSTRKYWPRCALLHRCGDDAGCCNSLEHTCAVETSENVDLYFFVYDSTRARVQILTFANHTKCSCQPKSVVAPQAMTRTDLASQCKCPKHFSVVLTPTGQCACDCADGKSTCRKYKRGKRYFSGTDINCIASGECTAPNCEYGPFVQRKRRCTKRRERERYTTN